MRPRNPTFMQRVYCCAHCRTECADHDSIICKAFQGKHGRAYLFSDIMNVTLGSPEERALITGLHIVADIRCAVCGWELGWKYEQAPNPTQKYKEGKFIIEKARVVLAQE